MLQDGTWPLGGDVSYADAFIAQRYAMGSPST